MQVRILDKHGDEVARFNLVNTNGSAIDHIAGLKEKLQKMYPPKQFKIRITL
jgi:hypothetical protein